jgi:hypothetical protein
MKLPEDWQPMSKETAAIIVDEIPEVQVYEPQLFDRVLAICEAEGEFCLMAATVFRDGFGEVTQLVLDAGVCGPWRIVRGSD